MYCGQCGFNVEGGQQFCTACGSRMPQPPKTDGFDEAGLNSAYQSPKQQQPGNVTTYFAAVPASPPEGNAFLWGLLGYVISPISFIFFFVWRQQYPKRAKAMLWGGIIALVVYFTLGPYLLDELGTVFKLVSNL